MKRIDTDTAQTDKFGGGKDGFTNGAAPTTPPTQLDCTWFDHVQEEIAGFIEAEGGTLDDEDYGQLRDAVISLIETGSSALRGTGRAVSVPAITLVPGTTTVSAERVGAQSAPTASGVVGDRYTDSQGRVQTCRVAGTPGTFRAIGALQTRQVLTASSGTYTTPVGCTAINIRCVGGGGGGGGLAISGGGNGAGSGGGSGAYCEKLINGPGASYAYTCGAGGAGGASGNSYTAQAGGSTTFDTLTAPGGSGGGNTAESAGEHSAIVAGGAGGAAATNGDINLLGTRGKPGISVQSTNLDGIGGEGASSYFGRGGEGCSNYSAIDGGNATGYGAGGGGCVTGGASGDGGSGSSGCIVVEEYY